MSYDIKLLPIVYIELQEAKEWYGKKSKILVEDFKKEVNKEMDYIATYPEYYQKKYKEVRQSLVTRFPYAIFYLIEKEKKHIVVLGILHTRRNPEIIRKRMKK